MLNTTFTVKVKGAEGHLEFGLTEQLQQLMKLLRDHTETTWKKVASEKLDSSKDEYLEKLDVKLVNKYTISVHVPGFLPAAVEEGISAFDMGQKLFANTSKSYKVIPINGKKAGAAPCLRTISRNPPVMRPPKKYCPGSKISSKHSPQAYWQHPGIEGKHLYKDVKESIVKELPVLFFKSTTYRKQA